MVEYYYDVWGNYAINDTSNIGLGEINPFRYRGYFYDTDMGLYYLKTRYYDPEVGRFINMDSIFYADVQVINGLNLYAYCGNNPVVNIDKEGTFFLTALLVGALVGMVVGGAVAGVSSANNGAEGLELVGDIAAGVLVGAAIGATIGAGIGLVGAGVATIGGGGAVGGIAASGGVAAAVASTSTVAGIAATITTGTVLVGAGVATAGVLGKYLFSKHDPGMSSRSPVSWTSFDEGVQAFKNAQGDAGKAAEQLMNQKYGLGKWRKGARTEYNALKKWLDRIIRGRI